MFILDTNVLMHDPTALFRFQEHDLYLPMVVLEELDAAKKGASEIARNVREVSRLLDETIRDADEAAIGRGIPLPGPMNGASAGRLFFQTRTYSDLLPEALPGSKPDNGILNVARALDREHPGRRVVIVSKDLSLRIKARALGIHAEDYHDDVVLDDVSLLYPGVYAMPDGDLEDRLDTGGSWQEDGRTFHVAGGVEAAEWFPNQCLYRDGAAGAGMVVRRVESGRAVIEPARDYRTGRNTVWGVNARNIEQNFALNLLMDPDIDFVTLIGTAGTGKDPARARGGTRPDPRRKALPRDRDDPGHRAGRRRHRVPTRHRRGEDDPVDGGTDGQPRGPDRPGGRWRLGGARRPTICFRAVSRFAR